MAASFFPPQDSHFADAVTVLVSDGKHLHVKAPAGHGHLGKDVFCRRSSEHLEPHLRVVDTRRHHNLDEHVAHPAQEHPVKRLLGRNVGIADIPRADDHLALPRLKIRPEFGDLRDRGGIVRVHENDVVAFRVVRDAQFDRAALRPDGFAKAQSHEIFDSLLLILSDEVAGVIVTGVIYDDDLVRVALALQIRVCLF